MSIRYVDNRVFNGPCTMAGSSVLDSMIDLYHHANVDTTMIHSQVIKSSSQVRLL